LVLFYWTQYAIVAMTEKPPEEVISHLIERRQVLQTILLVSNFSGVAGLCVDPISLG